MKAFFAKHQFIILWILGLVIIGAATVLIIQLNSVYVPTASVLPGSPAISTSPTPIAPSVTLVIQAKGKMRTLIVRWSDLPAGTTALDIFRSKTTATSSWELWKTVSVPVGQALSGNAQFDLTANDLGYQYYVQAVGSGTNGQNGIGGGQNGSGSNVLWTSSSTSPTATTSGTLSSGTGAGGGQNSQPYSQTQQTTSASTTQGNANSTSSATTAVTGTNTATSGTTGSGGGAASGGNPYYNPQVQVMGYAGTQGSFWVQHVNQSIEVGWQDLPSSTNDLIFFRAASSTGPWNQFLVQKDPGSTGSYSLQIVDGTLNEPFYYEMTAMQGTVSSITYGPIYLAPIGQ